MTKEQLLQQLLSNISDEYDKAVGSFFYDAEKPVAIELFEIYGRLEEIVQNGYARTAVGEWLDFKVAEQGLERKSATFATGNATISGNNGTYIPIGTKVASNSCIFSTVQETTIVDGTAEVAIIADTAGVIGNAPSGTINRFPVTIGGLSAVTNTAPTEGGYDAETDDALRERYFEKVTQPATSGNIYHYRLWAKEVVGVGDVRIIPLWNGAGTVKVIITDADGGVAPAELISAVLSHIEDVRPIGADVTVVSATPKIINIQVHIAGDSTDVARSVKSYLDTIQFGQGETEVSYAKVGKAILQAVGVADWTDLKINGGERNITLTDEEVAVLGSCNFTQLL